MKAASAKTVTTKGVGRFDASFVNPKTTAADGESMLKVCLICKEVFGCYRDKAIRACDFCDLSCKLRKQNMPVDASRVSHGVCDTCLPNRTRFS
jgi:hypothetical protein